MAEKESLAEESKWLIELLRLLWVTLLAIGEGRINDGLFQPNYRDRCLCFYHRSCMDDAWDNIDPVGDMPCTKQS